MFPATKKKTAEVFGVSNRILPDSYVDRGSLDERLQSLLGRPVHIALRGESKCGKSWLRQKTLPNAITVQCRLNKKATDVYVDVLSQLEIRLSIEDTKAGSFKGKIEATGSMGIGLLAKIGLKMGIEEGEEKTQVFKSVGHDINDLRYIAYIIRESKRRVVLEDFHYMSVEERQSFSFDLKALWDYGVFMVIIGVWSQSNMLIFLNPDLTGRIEEVPIYWSDTDLDSIIEKGGAALKIVFGSEVKQRAIENCFGNAGILQRLVLGTLDEMRILEECDTPCVITTTDPLDAAAMAYAEQLNARYQQFAKQVSNGIRSRQNATGIYAHAMAAILTEPDQRLISGLPLDQIYAAAHARQPRIQKGNLRTVLEKFEELQVDKDGRNLVLSYNEATSEITVVDRQVLLYRRYATVKWPWEDMIAEAEASGTGFGD
ncbi:MAG: hypothetical protein ACYCZX_17965 [Rhodospirillaceae bacterium]